MGHASPCPMSHACARRRRAAQNNGEMREMGVRGVLVYCHCGHHVALSADIWLDEVRLSDLEPRFVYQGCGYAAPTCGRTSSEATRYQGISKHRTRTAPASGAFGVLGRGRWRCLVSVAPSRDEPTHRPKRCSVRFRTVPGWNTAWNCMLFPIQIRIDNCNLRLSPAPSLRRQLMARRSWRE